jgi:hypothetical protein
VGADRFNREDLEEMDKMAAEVLEHSTSVPSVLAEWLARRRP